MVPTRQLSLTSSTSSTANAHDQNTSPTTANIVDPAFHTASIVRVLVDNRPVADSRQHHPVGCRGPTGYGDANGRSGHRPLLE